MISIMFCGDLSSIAVILHPEDDDGGAYRKMADMNVWALR
jgi:hypothetical protein